MNQHQKEADEYVGRMNEIIDQFNHGYGYSADAKRKAKLLIEEIFKGYQEALKQNELNLKKSLSGGYVLMLDEDGDLTLVKRSDLE